MKELAIIGPTASGKSDLALRLARECNAYILSLDSLSVYQEIDIASAKPSKEELASVHHFGVDVLRPNEHFDVTLFFDLYRDARAHAEHDGKNLIIVGGTSFYLKSLLTGLSETPAVTETTREKAADMLRDLDAAYRFLAQRDPDHMQSIAHNDRYRIEKMLHIYLQSGQTPTQWFAAHPPHPLIKNLPLYAIDVERSVLRERIRLRTEKMIGTGLVDEVARLELTYGRLPNSMKAIGIVEVLDYLDGRIDFGTMKELVITHTAQLAKRQQTFNRNQFSEASHLLPDAILIEARNRLLQ